MVTRAPAGAASSRSRRFEANTRTASVSAARPQPHAQIDVEMHLDLGTPCPARGLHQPAVARPALIGNAEALHDLQFVGARAHRSPALAARASICSSRISSFSPRNIARMRCDGSLFSGSAEIEIVLELLAFGLLALAHGRTPSGRSTTSARATRRSGRRLRRNARPEWRARLRAPRQHRPPAFRRRRILRPPPADRFAAASATVRPAARGRLPWRSPPWCGASA